MPLKTYTPMVNVIAEDQDPVKFNGEIEAGQAQLNQLTSKKSQ